MARATFAAGCFWGPEAAFSRVNGVTGTSVGYTGGHKTNPTYEEVCSGTTGHAEAVQVEFDPEVVTYAELLELFWDMHDPTQLNRQGPDFGEQYRSAVFCHDEEQRAEAEASKAARQASGKVRGTIVTTIEPAPDYWPAEDYHQQFFAKRGMAHGH